VTAADITPEWMTAVLSAEGLLDGARVSQLSSEPIGDGQMCQMLRVTIEYDSATTAPTSVIAKLPVAEPRSLALAQAMGMYELETGFYRDVVRGSDRAEVPRCYFAAIDPETSRFTLLLEDLSARTRPGDVLQATSVEDCARVLDALVRFQAPQWNSPALHDRAWLGGQRRTHALFDAMQDGLDGFIQRFGAALEPEHVALFNRVLPQAGAWARSWKPPLVLQHGDFRADNVLFATDPTATAPVTIVDFQTVRAGPPGIDVAYFLGSALDTDQRRAAEHELVEHYHHGLVRAGIQDYSFEACWNGYRAGALYAVFLFVGLSAQIGPSERAEQVIASQIRRYADMALDLDAAAAGGLISGR
jgi:hypothetical protein